MANKLKVTDFSTDSVTVEDSVGNVVHYEADTVSWVDIQVPLSASRLRALISFAKTEFVKHCTSL